MIPNEHPAYSWLSTAHEKPINIKQITKMVGGQDVLGRCREIGIIKPTFILHTQQYPVSALATLLEIVVLEIERVLGEPVFIRDIMDRIGHVKRICDGGVEVGRVGWVQTVVVSGIEDE